MISSKHYHLGSIFNEELEKIFSGGWIFACISTELANHNDFVTVDLGKFVIAVQNFKGVIKAYKNICLHRFYKIQTQKKGNRPFFCGYHGWSYNALGEALVSSQFQQEVNQHGCLKLESYQIEAVGNFCFVKLDDSSISLKEFLGDYFNVLQNFSHHIGQQIFSTTLQHKANWKLLVENVLECYHCKTVHSESFIPMGIGMLKATNFRNSQQHNDCEYPKKPTDRLEKRSKKLSFLNHRKLKHESYHHVFIYPNLFLSSTEGNLFYVGNFTPLTPLMTDLDVRFFEPIIEAPAGEVLNKFLMSAFYETSIESALNVLLEDKVVLEEIQSVVDKIDRNPIFGNEEFRINNFYTHYFKAIQS
jgi:choline monooxygenase